MRRVCRCFLLNLLLHHIWTCCRYVKKHSIVDALLSLSLYTFSFSFHSFVIVDKTYPGIKITQAYHSNHLIDYLVCLVLSTSFAFELDFNFALSLSRSLLLFVYLSSTNIYTKKNCWLAFLFAHENQSSKDYLLCNCPIPKERTRERKKRINQTEHMLTIASTWRREEKVFFLSSFKDSTERKCSSVTKVKLLRWLCPWVRSGSNVFYLHSRTLTRCHIESTCCSLVIIILPTSPAVGIDDYVEYVWSDLLLLAIEFVFLHETWFCMYLIKSKSTVSIQWKQSVGFLCLVHRIFSLFEQ